MATRFGAASPAQTYAARVRWLVGCLVAVILILVSTLVYVARDGEEPNPESSGVAVASTTPVSPQVDILVAIQRVEEGTGLMPFMFAEQPVPTDRIPEGAILARDKATIVGKYAGRLINANLPLIREDVTDSKPISAVTSKIPPGFRAVTITVDARSSVEGWAQPDTRVDVLWTYNDRRGGKKVATIVHFCKILSVGGLTSSEGKNKAPSTTTVTLLVSELDAKKIELARTTGTLSLSLVGERETGIVSKSAEPIDISSLLPRRDDPEGEPPPEGVMYTVDPRTGEQIRYELSGRSWQKGN